MTWVKLCGMRSKADVEAAAAAGADAVGFVLSAESIRRVDVEEARRYGQGAPIERFLVTTDTAPDELLEMAGIAGATGVQPHGLQSRLAAEAALAAGLRVLFPVTVTASVDVSGVPPGAVPILDAPTAGGGRRFDWDVVPLLDGEFVVAGGLNPENVVEAVRRFHPYGVDVSSGIEAERGVKDPDLMRAFVEAVR